MTLTIYLSNVHKHFSSGAATEHTYRGDLQALLSQLLPGLLVTNEPKRQQCGAPDYIISRETKGRDALEVGYIEAKDIGEPLEGKKHKEQFDRYRAALANLIITDYLDFHFYREGERTVTVRIGEVKNGKVIPLPEHFDKFIQYIKDFALFQGQTVKSPEKLAKMMAAKARLLANVIHSALESDELSSANNALYSQYEGFQKVLIHDIDTKGFADIYAQTIAYGMFAARLHDPTLKTFSREEAAKLIPMSNPFLRKLFQYIAGNDLDDRIVWIVDSLVEIFLATNVAELMAQHGRHTQRHDPVIHFYETFLAEYDASLRKARGVWYTPEPVVNFIVRAVDEILKTEFGLAEGLADSSKTTIKVDMPVVKGRGKERATRIEKVEKEVHRVQILDPACGTGTFLAEAVKHIYQDFESMPGIWPQYVKNDLVPRLHGFEILMASYAMAHLKMDLLLRETGYEAKDDQRFNIFLTNALEEHHPDTATLFTAWLSDEAQAANYIKRDTPVMVVMGNPPYSGHSANKGEWIESLLADYKQEPGGGKLQEKNPKWLNDDYVKFIRYGQFFVEKNREGVLAYISNNGFLDNPTFRGMRWHLLTTFDKIHIIDLHGNSKKKETAPDGSKDENVFDIQQGVSINLFVKTGKKKKGQLAEVLHCDLYGGRDEKYERLWANSLNNFNAAKLKPDVPHYFFATRDKTAEAKYNEGFTITDLFPVNSVGIVTARDAFTLHFTKEELEKTVTEFMKMTDEDARQYFNLGADVRDWKVALARKDLADVDLSKPVKVNYRPFDQRFTYYTGKSKGFHCMPRGEVMRHINGIDRNIGLVIPRQTKDKLGVFVSRNIIGHKAFSAYDINSIFPLYLKSIDCISNKESLNFNLKIINKIEMLIKLKLSDISDSCNAYFMALDLFDYIYAVLNSISYQAIYEEFLRVDFPRVPYPKDAETFWSLVKLGGELRQLHLLESPLLKKPITTYPKAGDNLITRKIVSKDWELYDAEKGLGRIWINDEQYIDAIPLIAWEFHIGGYQPAQKWLKDRVGRTLTLDDIRHYQKIIVALKETDRLMQEIDQVWKP